jgi:ABC-type nitrate/sulfonate/bicarbonate transport system substrate-binding protein
MTLRHAGAWTLAALLTLCAAAQAEPLKLRVGWVAAPGELPSIMGFKKDVAKHWGVAYDFQPIHFQGTPPMITALAAGEVELVPLAYSTLGLAITNARMGDLKIISDEFRDGVPGWHSNAFMVLKDGPVKEIADLKGKVVATNAIGSGIDVAMEYMLFKHQLRPPRDYTVIEAAFPNMKPFLLEHKADLITAINPFALDPELLAKGRTLYRQSDAVGGVTQMTVWAARGPFLEKNRAVIVDFLEDYLRILHWYLDPANRTEMLKIVSTFMHQPPERMDKFTFNHNDFYRDPNGRPDLKALQRNVDMAQTMGVLKSHLDVTKYVDLSYVEAAAKRLK